MHPWPHPNQLPKRNIIPSFYPDEWDMSTKNREKPTQTVNENQQSTVTLYKNCATFKSNNIEKKE
jgi:hypothetical protein